MIDADSVREARWLDPDDEPEEEEHEPTDEELAEQLNDHVLRAWDYLADNSAPLDIVLECYAQGQDPDSMQWLALTALLREAVEATKQ